MGGPGSGRGKRSFGRISRGGGSRGSRGGDSGLGGAGGGHSGALSCGCHIFCCCCCCCCICSSGSINGALALQKYVSGDKCTVVVWRKLHRCLEKERGSESFVAKHFHW